MQDLKSALFFIGHWKTILYFFHDTKFYLVEQKLIHKHKIPSNYMTLPPNPCPHLSKLTERTVYCSYI